MLCVLVFMTKINRYLLRILKYSSLIICLSFLYVSFPYVDYIFLYVTEYSYSFLQNGVKFVRLIMLLL